MICEKIRIVAEVLKLNQHPATVLPEGVKKQAEKTLNALLQLLG